MLKQLKYIRKPKAVERQHKYVTHSVVRFIPHIGLEAGETEENINVDLKLTLKDEYKVVVYFEEEDKDEAK